jgi:LysM domain
VRVGLALLACATALAQTTSDLQPAAPAPPAGTLGGSYLTGMPSPTLPPPAAAPEGGPRGKAVEHNGYYVWDDNSGLGGDEGGDVTVAPPESGTHTVRRGDTLWGLSATYFRNPWYWPKLWALNPSITNPHWIYPGDIIRLSSEAPAEAPVAGEPKPEQPKSDLPKLTGRPAATPGLFLRQNGFVEVGELEKAATIIGSKEEKIMLATLDDAYVQFTDKQPLEVGQKYSIYKPIRPVKHPQTGKKLGEIVEIFGEAQVKSVTDGKIARVTITDSTDTIERGYKVGILRRTFKHVPHKKADRDLAAVVVATLRPVELVGTDMLVFIDRGEKDGVELGNMFQIVRRGDGYQPLLWRGDPVDDKRFPREVLGQVEVVDLRDRLATGWVTRSTKEARIGDRVELHAGE